MVIGIGPAQAATLGYTFNALFPALLKEKAGPVTTKYKILGGIVITLLNTRKPVAFENRFT